ncbi:MAG: SDR family NAD(P)-dependent oxidoreductase [Spirochaetales bacterium]|nr:SDR family NAD(P)-dependent oxidoreductase [Spirochaetales bacterium]
MTVLVTGAMGIIGLNTVDELARHNHRVRVFDLPTKRNKRTAKKFKPEIEIAWGDVRNQDDVRRAVCTVDAVIHLAAVIPPLADKKPALAEAVNVGGTANLVRALEEMAPSPRLVFTSSISVYGDRVANPYIGLDDPLTPNPDDGYAHHKIACESIIRASRLDWNILRLSYIVSLRKLKMDPIMWDIPLDTSFEICDSADAALALVNALALPPGSRETLHIAGGLRCRISYRNYLAGMFELFGIGRIAPPTRAFKTGGFHCGFMDTERSERLLRYQRTTLEDYFAAVGRIMRTRRFFLRPIRLIARQALFARSPHARLAGRTAFQMARAAAPGRLH